MRIRDGHLPDGNVREHGREELAERQRHNEAHVVRPRHIGELPDAPQIEERPTVDGDAGQLHHGDGHREGELAEQHFADHIVAGGDDVPQQAQNADAERLAAAGRTAPLVGHDDDDEVWRGRIDRGVSQSSDRNSRDGASACLSVSRGTKQSWNTAAAAAAASSAPRRRRRRRVWVT